MNPLEDGPSIDGVEIGQGGDLHGSDDGGPPRRPDRSIWIWIVLGLLLVAAAIYFLWWRPRQSEVDAPGPTTTEATAPEAESAEPQIEEPQIALPTLDRSDAAVRQLLETLTNHPALASLVVPDRLVRRFVVSVDNIADGVSPRPHLSSLQPEAPFHTQLSEGELVATDETFDRYDRWTGLLESVDPSAAARLYRRLEPLMQEAYADLGYPDARFEDTLLRAVDRLIEAPGVPGDAKLVANVSSYGYRDPQFENLGEVEKHLARMGPANARRVQAHLAKLRDAITSAPVDASVTESESGEAVDDPGAGDDPSSAADAGDA